MVQRCSMHCSWGGGHYDEQNRKNMADFSFGNVLHFGLPVSKKNFMLI